jgi:AraC-like DNA-binding protein
MPSPELCFSMRLTRCYLAALEHNPKVPRELLAALWERDPDEREPIVPALERLHQVVEYTGDVDLGLKAARASSLGDFDVIEYAASSSPTGRVAMDVLCRYAKLLNDDLRIELREEAHRGVFMVSSTLPLIRAAADFQVAAIVVGLERWIAPDEAAQVEVFYRHPQPADIREYQRALGPARVHFSAALDGFSVPRSYLERPLPTGNAKLHSVLLRHAEQLLEALPRAQSFTEQVRDLLIKALPEGRGGAEQVADALDMSRRTLTRRLEQEQTTFKDLLDELRRSLATHYLKHSELGISEIAFLLGFGHGAAFNRAFRRWFAQTPLEYRRRDRGITQ